MNKIKTSREFEHNIDTEAIAVIVIGLMTVVLFVIVTGLLFII